MFLSFCIALVLSLATKSLAQDAISLNPSSKSGSSASDALDASFAGFGIEPNNLYSFTGGEEPNHFSVQLMQNLADYSGAPPHIRLGGNTQDYIIYDKDFEELRWKKNPDSKGQGVMASDSMIIGPGYFKVLDRFPKGTPITYGLNLAYSDPDYLDRIVAGAKGALEGMKNVKLYSFEIGNEPDLYLQNQFRTGSWDGETYTEQFLERAKEVYEKVLKPAGKPSEFFEPPATASTIGTTFEISMLVDHGLMDEVDGNQYVSVWNQHDYFSFIGITEDEINLDNLMDLDKTNTQFEYWEKQVKIALDTGLPYVLREMSSVGPIGMHEVSDTHGAALWTLNFFLYMATLNVASVQMHMTDNSNASAWQPIPMAGRERFVRPQYYAHAAMAQIIGNGNGTTQIDNLSIRGASDDYSGKLRAYSAYAHEKLQAVILINSKRADASESNKKSFRFNVNFGSANGDKDVYLSYLTAPGADSMDDTTWNGIQYDNSDGKAKQVDSRIKTFRTSSSGSVSIPVRDSEAVVANLGSLLGTNAVLKSNGETVGKKNAGSLTRSSGASTAMMMGIIMTILALVNPFTEML